MKQKVAELAGRYPSTVLDDFAVLLIIGTKWKMFRLARAINLPYAPGNVTPPDYEAGKTLSSRRSEIRQRCIELMEAGTVPDMIKAQVEWKQQPEGVFDVNDANDHAGIIQILETLQAVAKKVGDEECSHRHFRF